MPPRELLSEYTFWDTETRNYIRPTPQQHKEIFEKLLSQYPNLYGIDLIFPYIILEFEDNLPPGMERPFLIAGLIAVFLLEGEPFPLGVRDIGRGGGGPPAIIPAEIKSDLRPYHCAKIQTIYHLFTMIPNASYISVYPRQLLVETEPMSSEQFESFIVTAPRALGFLACYYYNGPLLHIPAARVKTPNPQFDDTGEELSVDDANYLLPENGSKLRPGCMLECLGQLVGVELVGQYTSNAGIVVRQGEQIRLTCAYHTWDEVNDKKAYHAGTLVGAVDQCLGEDIGLIEPLVPVSNKFLEVQSVAKTLISSNHVHDRDLVSVDSCYTGPQTLQFAGSRFGRRRPRGPGPSYPNFYITLDQGIYTTSTPFIPTTPVVRLGMCGTPLLRIGNVTDAAVQPAGEILGFFLWCDMKGYDDTSLYCYAQSCDPLIDEGWAVADLDETGNE